MNQRTPGYSISISFLIIASLIYQLPVVRAARFVPSAPASDSRNKAEEAALFLPTSTASLAPGAVEASPVANSNSAALSDPNSNATAAANPLSVLAPSITATLADDILLGAKKNPGDTITYTAVISNGGASPADDALGVIFSDILDNNTTLVPGSANAQPIAKPDAYTASGNIPISLAAPGVLTNDVDPITGTSAGLTVTEVQGSGANVGVATNTTAVGRGAVNGSVTLGANGSFTYEPPPGFTGTDTFTYKTSEGTLTDTNTVTITISNMVWFIRNTGGGLNRGTFSNPFTTIATFNTANAGTGAVPDPKNGDFISLRGGPYNEVDGVNLRNTQKLIGEAVQFSTAFTADSNSSSAYTTFAGATNTAPSINTTAGNGIDLADSNTVRGLNVSNTPGFFKFNGSAVGSPTINTVTLGGQGGAMNVSTSGAFGGNVNFGAFESTSSLAQNLNLVGVTGTLGVSSGGAGLSGSAVAAAAINVSGGSVSFTYPGNVTKSNANSLLSVSGGHDGTITFQTGTVSATIGDGLQFNNADGTYNFNGTTTLNGGDAGVDILNDSAGTFGFGTSAAITSPAGIAFNVDGLASTTTANVTYSGNITQASNAAMVNVKNHNTGTITFQTNTLNATNGTGLQFDNCDSTTSYNFNGTTTLNGGDAGIDILTGSNGNFTFASGSSITNPSGTSFNINGGTGNVTYNGTITDDVGLMVAVANATGGTKSFTGAITDNNDGDGTEQGVSLTTNTNATISFSGGLAIRTTTNPAFTATGGGTVNATQNNGTIVNTLTTTTGTALNVANTTIGVSGLTFRSISANGATNGIVLNSTGTNGLTVTGTDGADAGTDPDAGTGGTIQSASGNGISLTNANNISLGGMTISGTGGHGINISGGSNLTLTGTQVTNAGNADNEYGLNISNTTGSVTLSLATFNNAADNLVYVTTTGALTFTVNNNSNFSYPASVSGTANSSILIEPSGSGAVTASIQNSTFTNIVSVSAQIGANTAGANGTQNFTFSNNTINVTLAARGSGVAVSGQELTTTNITINNNNFSGAGGNGVINLDGNDTSIVKGTISGNTITNPPGHGIVVAGDEASKADVTINGNTITNSGGDGIQTVNFGGVGVSSMDLLITNNTVNGNGSNSGVAFVGAINFTAFEDNSCITIRGNTVTGTVTTPGNPRVDYYVQGAGNTTFEEIPNTAETVLTNTYLRSINNNSGTSTSEVFGSILLTNGGTCNVTGLGLMAAPGGVEAAYEDVSSADTSNYVLSLRTDLNSEHVSFPSITSVSRRSFAGSAIVPSRVITASVSQRQVDTIVAAAIERWLAAGLTQQQIATLRGIKFNVADLEGAYLGESGGRHVLIDRNAGGKGWYIGSDSSSDSLFSRAVSNTRRYTDPMSAPAGQLDLLTAIGHEMGHKLGLDDTYSASDRDNLMYGYLTVGERRLPAQAQAQYAKLGNDTHKHFLMLSVAETKRPAHLPTSGKSVSNRSGEFRMNHSPTPSSVKRESASDDQPLSPLSGETVTVNGSGSGFTLPGGDSVTITFQATVNTPPFARTVQTQGQVSGSNFTTVNTNDPETAAPGDATVTNINTTSTWTGATSTDWNTATNWTPNTYAPGVSNPAVNDVVIPNVGAQPNISATDIGIFSLNISNGRTLTITNPRVLTIGGSPGGDLTLDGIISDGFLNLGSGTHVINNAGGTGSLSSTNVATVLSGSTVTLNNNLQAGALAVNVGGSMNITSRTLSLNGSGGLAVGGGATFTTTGSTVVFNGTAAQTAAGISYNNLTINNTIGAHVTGVTLNGNATVNGALTLTSSDLATGAFTLTMPNTATSGPASGATDVVGNVKRTGFASGGIALSFGNPFNTIRINSGAAPTDINILIAKNAPTTYAAAVLRSYIITPNGANGPATLRLHYRQAELNGNSETPTANFNLRRGPNWGPAVVPTSRNVGVVEDNWLENNVVTTFSEWTFSNLAPTAAGGTVTGRIMADDGTPVEGAVVMLSGAQNRKFITDANGFYRFENVETNGFYNVTPSRVNYTFSPSAISFSQIGETTNATFGASATGGNINPLDTPEYFVRQHYLDFLGREPEEAGFNFWSDQIIGCGDDTDCAERKKINVSAAYFFSIEFQETGGLVDGLYRVSYGVRPQFAEFRPDAAAVAPGLVVGNDGWQGALESGKTAFVEAFVQRAAFRAAFDGMSNETYVDVLIANTGVSFTAAERDSLVSGLGSGDLTRATVLRAVAENGQFVNAKRNQAFVMMEYFGYLRREPDADGYQFWLHKLNQFNGNFEQAEMVKSFIISGEYRLRFPR